MEENYVRQVRCPKEKLLKILDANSIEANWMDGDGSDRSYFRLCGSQPQASWVLMQLSESDKSALAVKNYDWIKIRELLEFEGVKVPKLVAVLAEYGEIVIEDCKDELLVDRVMNYHKFEDWNGIKKVYQRAYRYIARFLKIEKNSQHVWNQRAFDVEKFTFELNMFVQKFVVGYKKLSLSLHENQQLRSEINLLSHFLACRPQFFVHRDFHSKNLMLKDGSLVVIDFQDARLGPCAYDLVSLCYDPYVPLSIEQREILFNDGKKYFFKNVDQKIISEIEDTKNAVISQRLLKALGSFAYLTLQLKRGDYLKYSSAAIESLNYAYDHRWPFLTGKLVEKLNNTSVIL